jgi:hypothetical protein
MLGSLAASSPGVLPVVSLVAAAVSEWAPPGSAQVRTQRCARHPFLRQIGRSPARILPFQQAGAPEVGRKRSRHTLEAEEAVCGGAGSLRVRHAESFGCHPELPSIDLRVAFPSVCQMLPEAVHQRFLEYLGPADLARFGSTSTAARQAASQVSTL